MRISGYCPQCGFELWEEEINISKVLADPKVHYFTKEIIKKALRRDIVDAIADIESALEVVKGVCNERLHPSQPSTDKGQPPNFQS